MKSKIDFVKGKTVKSLLLMVMPLLAAMILTMAYNLVDSLWVGNLLGENGYASLTNSTAIVLILSAIAMGTGNGIAILVSQKVGSGEKDEADGIISTIVLVSCAFSIMVTIIMELSLKVILNKMSTPAELFDGAYEYLAIYLIGYAAIFIYMQFTSVFRSFGDPVFQMKGMLFTTIFNGMLDPILIKIMGLGGAAWATVLSEVLCVVYSICYYRKKEMFCLNFRKASLRFVKPILRCAVPSAVQQCMPAISSAAMLFLVTKYGVTAIAAYGVTNKLEILLFYPAMAMNMGLTTIAGQCFGAERKDRVKDYQKAGLLLGGIFTTITTVLVVIFAKELSGLFVDSRQAAEIVENFFRIISIGYTMYMITSCFLGIISGSGKPGISMLLFFIYYIVIRIPLAVIFAHSSMGLNGIWRAILISHVIAALAAGIFEHMIVKAYHPLRSGTDGHNE